MLKILVVDDSIIMRKTLVEIFESLGHKVIAEANDGYEAIKKYQQYQPDLTTMDITMPTRNNITNGVDALEQIKLFNSYAKVAMITSHGEEELVMNSIQLGAKGYLLKPITNDKVVELLNKIF